LGVAAQAVRAGAESVFPVADRDWGDREELLRDLKTRTAPKESGEMDVNLPGPGAVVLIVPAICRCQLGKATETRSVTLPAELAYSISLITERTKDDENAVC